MKNILAQLTANNQVLFRYTDRGALSTRKKETDNADIQHQEIVGRCQSRVEDANSILLHGCKEYEHTNYSYYDYNEKNSGRSCVSGFPPRTKAFAVVPVRFPACRLDNSITYFDNDSGKVVTESYSDVCQRKRGALDIIRKSQQPSKKERTWGLPQTKKSFTNNAKQKILEAGAIVELDTNLGDQYEVTLTLPGSGIDVYCTLANWSGYIVNRLTQIIRRWEQKGCPVYWFFVWEHQKRGALHMHWCIAIPGEPMLADCLSRQIRAKWFELLEELSVKTRIDLFKKRGFSGTWRHSPDKWQSRVTPVRKSVAAYFSKYCSKNVQTRKHNDDRRERYASKSRSAFSRNDKQGTLSLYPSRYWGCGYRVKQRCNYYRVSISIPVSDESEGDFIRDNISKWMHALGDIKSEVSRIFKVTDHKTSYVYAVGWETRLWFSPEILGCAKIVFDMLAYSLRNQEDRIGIFARLVQISGVCQ